MKKLSFLLVLIIAIMLTVGGCKKDDAQPVTPDPAESGAVAPEAPVEKPAAAVVEEKPAPPIKMTKDELMAMVKECNAQLTTKQAEMKELSDSVKAEDLGKMLGPEGDEFNAKAKAIQKEIDDLKAKLAAYKRQFMAMP